MDLVQGVFTAPIKGGYFFAFTSTSGKLEESTHVNVYKNGKAEFSMVDTETVTYNYHTLSGSWGLNLNVGDTVHLEVSAGHLSVYNIWYLNFSGHLVKAFD